MTNPHPTPHRATDEQWRRAEAWPQDPEALLPILVLELREALAALERRVEALEGPAAEAAELRAALQQENRRLLAQEAPAPAAAPPPLRWAATDRYELGDIIRLAWLKHGNDSWCSIADDVLAAYATPPRGEAPPPAGSLVEVVARAIHPSVCDDPNLYLHEARAAIAAVAEWCRTERGWKLTADSLEREAGR